VRIYVPALAAIDHYEWALPIVGADFQRLRIETFERVASSWTPVEMKLLREDEGNVLEPADLPWLGEHALVMRRPAADLVASLVEGQAELLPLSCVDAELFLLHVTECRDALDEDRSELVRFSTGRIMTIDKHVFDAGALNGVRFFKIPQMPTGPMFMSGEVVDGITSAGFRGFGAKLVWESRDAPRLGDARS
jgi:hypothetical protein